MATERYDTHTIIVPLSSGGAQAKLTMDVANGQILGVVFGIPSVQLKEADISAINAGYQELRGIATDNGYTWTG